MKLSPSTRWDTGRFPGSCGAAASGARENPGSPDGANWTNELNYRLPVGGTSDGPSVTYFNNLLHVVWKGLGDDQRIFTITGTGTWWDSHESRTILDGGSVLYLAWKGVPGDNRLFYAVNR